MEVRFPPDPQGAQHEELDPRPLEILLHSGRRMVLCGRIDRIDISPDGLYARVVDYKSGKRGKKPDDLNGGRQLQLLVYSLAVLNMLTPRGVQEVNAQYYYVSRQGNFKRDELSASQIVALKDTLREIVESIVEGIFSGLFIPAGDAATCRGCDFREACGSTRGTVFSSKKDHPILNGFNRLRSIGQA